MPERFRRQECAGPGSRGKRGESQEVLKGGRGVTRKGQDTWKCPDRDGNG